jgi:hypothetical protein
MARSRIAPVLLLTAGLVQGQAPDLAGEWRVARSSAVGPPSLPLEEWLRSQPSAVYTFSHNTIPPFAMFRKDLGYVYSPSISTITIFERTDALYPLGFLQTQGDRRVEGELAPGGCWLHLSLAESEDGSTLLGTARINTKYSTRECRKLLTKEVKKGAPFQYALIRLK